MAEEIKSRNLTQREFDRDNAPFELDLTAFFSEMRDGVERLLIRAQDDGWTQDKFIKEVEKLI